MDSRFTHSDIQKEFGGKFTYELSNVIIEASNDLGALILGDDASAKWQSYLKSQNITIVLDVAGVSYKYAEGMIEHCKVVAADDTADFDLSAHFEDCFDYIHKHRTKGHNVLVHCQLGVSRSSTIVIGYLMKYEKMSLREAYSFVLKKRKCIHPNEGFLRQLFTYEDSLNLQGFKDMATQEASENQ